MRVSIEKRARRYIGGFGVGKTENIITLLSQNIKEVI